MLVAELRHLLILTPVQKWPGRLEEVLGALGRTLPLRVPLSQSTRRDAAGQQLLALHLARLPPKPQAVLCLVNQVEGEQAMCPQFFRRTKALEPAFCGGQVSLHFQNRQVSAFHSF